MCAVLLSSNGITSLTGHTHNYRLLPEQTSRPGRKAGIWSRHLSARHRAGQRHHHPVWLQQPCGSSHYGYRWDLPAHLLYVQWKDRGRALPGAFTMIQIKLTWKAWLTELLTPILLPWAVFVGVLLCHINPHCGLVWFFVHTHTHTQQRVKVFERPIPTVTVYR